VEHVFAAWEVEKALEAGRMFCSRCSNKAAGRVNLQSRGTRREVLAADHPLIAAMYATFQAPFEKRCVAWEIAPKVFGQFQAGKAPGTWEPKSELEIALAERLGRLEPAREARPFVVLRALHTTRQQVRQGRERRRSRMVWSKPCTAMLGLLCIGGPVNTGWVEPRALEPDGIGAAERNGWSMEFPPFRGGMKESRGVVV
jgi:hypothetical protein